MTGDFEVHPKGTGDQLRLLDDLKQAVIAFVAPWAVQWAVQWAADHGLPKGHLHPHHYDILDQCGGRMADFTRAEEPAG